MGQESYHFLMFDKRNQAIVAPDEYGDNILDIVGGFVVGNSFLETAEVISSIMGVSPYSPADLFSYQSPRCYYTLDDGNCIIEIEMNCGELAEQVEEISIRFAVSNPIETYEKTIGLCKLLCEKHFGTGSGTKIKVSWQFSTKQPASAATIPYFTSERAGEADLEQPATTL
jgi:hypothetical protein